MYDWQERLRGNRDGEGRREKLKHYAYYYYDSATGLSPSISRININYILGIAEESSNVSWIDCGLPTVLKGARILMESYTTTESSQITLICTEGLFSNYTITSVCTREGKWHPDPAKFSCLPKMSSGM